MNTTQKTLAALVTAVLLGSGLTACSDGAVAPTKIRQESSKTRPAQEHQGVCPMHVACAR